MIDEYWTFRFFGYRVDDLTHGSGRRVIAVCDRCGVYRDVEFKSYHDLCRSCVKIGVPYTEERKQNLVRPSGKDHHNYGKHLSDEQRKKISDANSGKNHYHYGIPLSDETKKKIGDGNRGKTRSVESRKKLSDALKGRKIPREVVEKIRIANSGERSYMFGKHHSPDVLQKLRDAKLGKKQSKESNKKRSDTLKGRYMGEESSQWKGGISFVPYCPKFNNTFKESIRDKYGRKCYLCNKTEERNKRRLSVHHVSYEKNCLCGGIECMFVPLCGKCHTITNFNRFFWEMLLTYALQYEEEYCSCQVPNLLISLDV